MKTFLLQIDLAENRSFKKKCCAKFKTIWFKLSGKYNNRVPISYQAVHSMKINIVPATMCSDYISLLLY